MQMFVSWSCIRIFWNEHTRSTQLDPKFMFWCVSEHLGAFGNVSLIDKARCKTGWNGAINTQVCATKSHRNFTQWRHPIHYHWTLNACIGAFCSIWVHFGLFCYCMKLGAKQAELEQLMQMFVSWSRIRIFWNEHTRSTQLDLKLMFWCVS